MNQLKIRPKFEYVHMAHCMSCYILSEALSGLAESITALSFSACGDKAGSKDSAVEIQQ